MLINKKAVYVCQGAYRSLHKKIFGNYNRILCKKNLIAKVLSNPESIIFQVYPLLSERKSSHYLLDNLQGSVYFLNDRA